MQITLGNLISFQKFHVGQQVEPLSEWNPEQLLEEQPIMLLRYEHKTSNYTKRSSGKSTRPRTMESIQDNFHDVYGPQTKVTIVDTVNKDFVIVHIPEVHDNYAEIEKNFARKKRRNKILKRQRRIMKILCGMSCTVFIGSFIALFGFFLGSMLHQVLNM